MVTVQADTKNASELLFRVIHLKPGQEKLYNYDEENLSHIVNETWKICWTCRVETTENGNHPLTDTSISCSRNTKPLEGFVCHQFLHVFAKLLPLLQETNVKLDLDTEVSTEGTAI